MTRAEAGLAAQTEARDRQADAFEAAISRIEATNYILVVVLGLAAVGGSLLAVPWLRSLARNQVAAQVSTAVRDTGREIFEASSKELLDEYDRKFAELYSEYKELVDREI